MIEDLSVVHRYDQRGGGRSTGDGPYEVGQFVEDLELLRAHWGHETWIVVGHSWGGWLALLYAAKYPKRVSALMAIGMPPPFSSGWRSRYQLERESRVPEEERTFFVDVASRRSNGEEISVEEERHWRLLNWRSDFADPEEAPTFDEEFPFPINTDVNRELGDEMTARDAAGTLLDGVDSLDLPALFLHGQRDPRPAAIDIAQALPSGRLVMIDGAGHLPWFERPEAVKEEFRRLVQHRV